MKKCICGTNHKSYEKQHGCIAKIIAAAEVVRDSYDAIVAWKKNVNELGTQKVIMTAKIVISFFQDCLVNTYVNFDRAGRGSALNHDIYGYDPSQCVAVIQTRQAFRHKKNHYMSTHKSYFLCGHNEITGAPFRHPISAAAVRGAVRSGADARGVVLAAQRWMWEVTDKQLKASVRQGDLLLVPERGEPQGEYMGQVMTIVGSHVIHASEIRKNGRIYAKNPQLIHVKGQHVTIAVQGWVSVRVAREVPAWDFATRIGD